MEIGDGLIIAVRFIIDDLIRIAAAIVVFCRRTLNTVAAGAALSTAKSSYFHAAGAEIDMDWRTW